MENLLIIFLANSAFIYGVYTLFSEGHLLENAGIFITANLGEKWSKPLINCPICMASFWGTFGFMFTGLGLIVIYWIIWCVCLCGFNAVVNELKSKDFNVNE